LRAATATAESATKRVCHALAHRRAGACAARFQIAAGTHARADDRPSDSRAAGIERGFARLRRSLRRALQQRQDQQQQGGQQTPEGATVNCRA
jgi:hypothetical protein